MKSIIATLGIFLCGILSAQTGAITGQITDQTHSAVPHAQIVVRSLDTGIQFRATTDNEGLYTVVNLPPASFLVTAELSGFKPATSDPVKLDTGDTARVDLILVPLDSKVLVDVKASAPVIESQTGMLETTITSIEIESMPIFSRNAMEMALTIPGVSGELGTEAGGIFQDVPTGGSGLNVGGGRAGSSSFLTDGSSSTSAGIGRSTTSFSPDTIGELKVITSSFSAQYGSTGGGLIQMISKSGSQQLRGTAFWYHQNPALAARQFNRPLPPQARNHTVGLTLGGPVVIPKIYNGRQRTFFFFSGEPRRWFDAIDIYDRLPTAEERQGDFRNSYVAPGQTRPLLYQQVICSPSINDCKEFTPVHRPSTTAEYPLWSGADPDPSKRGLVIPKAYLDPLSQLLLKNVPLPNQPFDANGRNYFGTRGVDGSDNRWSLKIDHNISAKNRLTGRYSDVPLYSDRYRTEKGNLFLSYPSDRSLSKNFQLTDSHTLSPRVVNEFRGNYNYSDFSRTPPGSLATTNYTKDLLGLPNQTGWGYPQFNAGFGTYGLNTGATLGRYVENQFQYADDLTMVFHRHTITVGGDWRYLQLNNKSSGLADACCGTYAFNLAQTYSGNSRTPGGTGGLAFASFLLGVPNSATLRGIVIPYYYRWRVGAAYFQDDYKIRRNLTLNLGLRWQYNSPRAEKYDRQASLDIDHPVSVLNPDASVKAITFNYLFSGHGRSKYLEPVHKRNFEPRFGFAWSPPFAWSRNRHVVMRGGYGISHVPTTGRGRDPIPDFGAGSSGAWGYTRWSNNNPPPLTQSRNPSYLITLGRNPPVVRGDPTVLTIPENGMLCQNCTPRDARVPGGSGLVFAQTNSAPYIQTWSLTTQTQLTGDVVLTLGYRGQKGTHLYSPLVPVNNPDRAAYEELLDSGGDPNELIPDPFGRVDTRGNLVNTTLLNLLRPFPTAGDINIGGLTNSNSVYHAGTFSLDRRYRKGLAMRFNYTWSKSIDDSSDAQLSGGTSLYIWGATTVQNARDLKNNRSVSSFDTRHRINFTLNAELPFGRGRTFFSDAGKWTQMLVGQWSISALGAVYSGYPFAPYLGVNDPNGVPGGNTAASRVRPDLLLGVPVINPLWSKNVANSVPYYNPSAFAVPAFGHYGNSPRTLDFARNPWKQTLNGSILREFHPFEQRRRYLQLRAEFYNVLNHATFTTSPGNNESPNLFASALPVSRTGLSLAGPIPYLVDLAGKNFPTGTRNNLLAASYNQNFGKLWRDRNGPGRSVMLALKIYF